MSHEFSERKNIIKGALVAVRSDSWQGALHSELPVFVFQYNPEMLVRTFSFANSEGTLSNDLKGQNTQGPPVEVIDLTLELDAIDQLENPDTHRVAVENGLHPALAALESMMYPKTSKGEKPKLPIVLFLWGPKRTVPVCLMNMKITEQAFDSRLNPIRAKIEISMRVLDRLGLKKNSLGYTTFVNNLNRRKENTLLYGQDSLVQTGLKQASLAISKSLAKKTRRRYVSKMKKRESRGKVRP